MSAVARPESPFPLIRHLSVRTTPWLARTPLSANQITTASLIVGLSCNACLAVGVRSWTVLGSLLLVVAYVLDNCDGEIARLKQQCSEFGKHYDTFVDFVVHTSFFVALGIGAERSLGGASWLWLGGIAAAGSTFNYLLALRAELAASAASRAPDASEPADAESAGRPQRGVDWVVFFFRELSRADFCFLFVILVALDVHWLLLPAGAIGAQVYWAMSFVRSARDHHA